jgi:hypothetical protein
LVVPPGAGGHHLDRQAEREVERPQGVIGSADESDQVGQGRCAVGGAGQGFEAVQGDEPGWAAGQGPESGDPGVAAGELRAAEIDTEDGAEDDW